MEPPQVIADAKQQHSLAKKHAFETGFVVVIKSTTEAPPSV